MQISDLHCICDDELRFSNMLNLKSVTSKFQHLNRECYLLSTGKQDWREKYRLKTKARNKSRGEIFLRKKV